MTYHRGVGQVTPAQVQPWLNLATQTATSIAQAVQQGQQPQTPAYDPAMYSPSPYAPAPTQQNWVVPVMLGGGLLLALGVGYVALNKRMQPNRRRRRRRTRGARHKRS